MKRPHPFRLEKRRHQRGRVYYVVYDADPAHPKSTGVLVNPSDRATKADAAGPQPAIAWAYAHMDALQARQLLPTIEDFCQDMFTAADPWVRLQGRKGRELRHSYLDPRRAWLRAYILPRWGSHRPEAVRAEAIDEWLLELEAKHTGLPLAPASLDRILWIMRHIFDQMAYRYPGSLSVNSARQVTPFDRGQGGSREPFTMDEIRRLFPRDAAAALRVWRTSSWYCYFLFQWTCGLRPGEAAGFMLQDWIRDLHGAVIKRTVDAKTGEIREGLKTEKRGMAVKPVVFSDQLEEALEELGKTDPADLLFRSINGLPIQADTAAKHLRLSAPRAGVDLAQRTQYCLRHTYYTELLKRLPEKEVARMAGHRALRKEYDHRQGVDFLRQAQPLRDVVNELTA